MNENDRIEVKVRNEIPAISIAPLSVIVHQLSHSCPRKRNSIETVTYFTLKLYFKTALSVYCTAFVVMMPVRFLAAIIMTMVVTKS